MKILILALISLGLGLLISKFFYSSQTTISQRYPTNKKQILIKKNIKIKPEIFQKKEEKINITGTILKSSEVFEKDPQEREKALEQIEGLLAANPQEYFLALKELLDNKALDEDPILKGNLLVEAAFIKGKESEVREMALNAILSENIPKEKELKDLSTDEEINKEFSDDPKVIGVAQAYDAFLATTINDEDQVFYKSLEIIEAHPNIKIRRLIAKKYVETFPSSGPAFWEHLKNKNIHLLPPGKQITIRGITYQ